MYVICKYHFFERTVVVLRVTSKNVTIELILITGESRIGQVYYVQHVARWGGARSLLEIQMRHKYVAYLYVGTRQYTKCFI